MLSNSKWDLPWSCPMLLEEHPAKACYECLVPITTLAKAAIRKDQALGSALGWVDMVVS